MPSMTLQVLGLREQVARFERMSDFKAAGKPAVQAALDIYKEDARSSVKKLTGKAQSSMGTHIHTKKWGVYGNAGPRGSGRFREGFIAALFLSTGTGEGLRNEFSVGGAKFGQQAPGGYQSIGGKRERIHQTRQAGLIYPAKARVMTFPGTKTIAQRFGSAASAFTYRGKYRARKFGNAGMAFAGFTRGMAPQPWAAASHAHAANPAREAFEKALRENIAAASRVH